MPGLSPRPCRGDGCAESSAVQAVSFLTAGAASAVLCSEAVAGADMALVLGSLQTHDCTMFLCRLSQSHFHPCHFPTPQEMGCAFSRGLKPSRCISLCILSSEQVMG